MIYVQDEQLIEAGFPSLYLGTSCCWFEHRDGRYVLDKIHLPAVDHFSACEYDREQLMVADIEVFKLYEDFEYGIEQLKIAVRRWKSNQPHRKLGFFGLMSGYDDSCLIMSNRHLQSGNLPSWRWYEQRLHKWRALNDATAKELLPLVDFLVPQVYWYGVPIDQWRDFADKVVEESIRISDGKPVYPMHMPIKSHKPIEPEIWADMVAFLDSHPNIESWMIHSSDSYNMEPTWREPLLKRMSHNA